MGSLQNHECIELPESSGQVPSVGGFHCPLLQLLVELPEEGVNVTHCWMRHSAQTLGSRLTLWISSVVAAQGHHRSAVERAERGARRVGERTPKRREHRLTLLRRADATNSADAADSTNSASSCKVGYKLDADVCLSLLVVDFLCTVMMDGRCSSLVALG